MSDRWILLVFRLPRDPSAPRLAAWRSLRRLGAAFLQDGVAALPLDSRTREQLEWLADQIIEDGGEAHVWLAQPASPRQGRELAMRHAEAVADEYLAVAREADVALDRDAVVRRRTVRRLRRELRRIGARDYFPPPERTHAIEAVERLAALEAVPA